jgi:phosphatidylinositol-3,4,5-trisphosphate 3-phosphatase/dual-specificity protein phosphatase PTEN
MGYPADGLASLYRNRRSDVVRFLEGLSPFRIFNLVPRFENSYDGTEFLNPLNGGEASVERFPWPDHHPPPLSLLPLASARAKQFSEADERNTVVIHCLAGKGRYVLFPLFLVTLSFTSSAFRAECELTIASS